MKKIILLISIYAVALRLSAQEQYYMGVTSTQQIYELAPVKFGGELTDEQKAKGLMTELLATRTFYSSDENCGCPTGKEQPLEKDEIPPYKDKVILVELEGKCPYGEKILAAQTKGAIAVVILQKEKVKETFVLEHDEFVEKIEIPCFVLSNFDENERLMMYAPSPALIYQGKEKIKGKVAKNSSTKSSETADFSLSPNPSDNEVMVNYKAKGLETGELMLLDATGKLIHRETLKNSDGTIYLDLSQLPSSVYNVLLEVTVNGEKIRSSKTLVKQ